MNNPHRIMLAIIILIIALMGVVQAPVPPAGTKPSPNVSMDDWPVSVSLTVKYDVSTSQFYSVFLNGSELVWSSNGTDVVQACLNTSSSLGGGCVYVLPGQAFDGSGCVLENGTRLVIELGVQGLTYSVASGATCCVVDYNAGMVLRYVSGTLMFSEDMTNGSVRYGSPGRLYGAGYQSSGSVAGCVNGTWIAHGLLGIPTTIIVALNQSEYISSSNNYIAPSAIAMNSTHFQIGFYTRDQPIDRFRGITPVAAGWDTPPTSLANCTDGDWSTVTGTGTTNTGTGQVGNLTWDMGSSYAVELRSKVGMWSNAGVMDTKWYWSMDNVTWFPVSNVVTSQLGYTSEYVAFSQLEFVYARYVRLVAERAGGVAGNANAKFYECQAWDLSNAVLPVTSANNATIFWYAEYQP